MKSASVVWHQRPLVRVVCLLLAIVADVALAYSQSTTTDGLLTVSFANALVTPVWVMKEVGRRLVNNLKFAANVMRSYDDQFVKAGAKVGYTVNARLPQRYKVNKGQALNPQPVIDNVVPITLTDQANVGLEFSTASLTMEVDNYRERYISPATDALVNAVDYDGLSRMYQAVFMNVGTPAVIPITNSVYLDAGVKLDNGAVPVDGRVAILSPGMHAGIANANLTLFNPSVQISEFFRKGQFAKEALGISEWFKDQNVATHTVGPLGGTPTVNAAGQTGSSIITQAWTSAVARRLNKGDVIQFAGVYQINPLNYQSLGVLQDFVVTANVDSTSGGAATIPIYPPLLDSTSGALQTVSNAPAASAAVTIFGHASSHANKLTPQGLVYHPEAFALVMADLDQPQGVWVSERISNKALGISIRFVKDYSISDDQSPARLDVLYGWAAVRPELAARVSS